MTTAVQNNNPEVETIPLLFKEGSPRKRAGWLRTTRSHLIGAAKPPIFKAERCAIPVQPLLLAARYRACIRSAHARPLPNKVASQHFV